MKIKPIFLLVAFGLIRSFLFPGEAFSDPLADGRDRHEPVHFVPNSQAFWDFSKNWTTNFGPAYRDTVVTPTNSVSSLFIPCTGQYALCFSSGPKPLPCELTSDGRFANCKCLVKNETNYVLITAILNYKVYLDTINVCGADGSGCSTPDTAPVCKAIQQGKLIPGADVISDFSSKNQSDILDAMTDSPPPLTVCPKAPYAACMTAPCRLTESGDAECSCPVFWGTFQLYGTDEAACDLRGNLVWSASYTPALDPSIPSK